MLDMESFYDLLKQLIRVPSVVGAEHPFFMFIKRELEEIGIRVEYYDGVLVAKGNEPQSGYMSAHVDRHGLTCTGENEFQYAAFIAKNQADLTGKSSSEQVLKNLTQRFADEKVQAYDPLSGSYLGLGVIKDAFMCQRRNNIIFKVDGLEYLFPAIPVAFMDRLETRDGFISAQLDNVISVAVIIHMFRLGYNGTAFFTASEEASRSWRFLLEWFRRFDVRTDELLVLDTSPYQTLDEIKEIDIVLRNRDSNAIFKSPLKSRIKKIAKDEGLRYSFKDVYLKNRASKNATKILLGSTELGRLISSTKGDIQGATLQIPTIGYHTTNETTTEKSIESVVMVLKKLYKIS